jgi:hypothetical protein
VSLLGEILAGQQKFAEAEPLLLRGYEGIKMCDSLIRGPDARYLTEAVERVVRFYELTRQPDKARVWRDKLPPANPIAH